MRRVVVVGGIVVGGGGGIDVTWSRIVVHVHVDENCGNGMVVNE